MASIFVAIILIAFMCWVFVGMAASVKPQETHAYDDYNAAIDKKLKGWI